MDSLKDIIQHCHQQRKKSLRQRKTIVTPALYKDYPYHFTVHCTRGYRVRLYDLEQANISFMPIGHAPEADHPPRDFGGERFLKRQGTRDWKPSRWYASWGIQIYTGVPSGRDGAQWHDINFKYDAISAAPDAVLACIEGLMNSVANPLLTLTKSGGLRFSCRVKDYLHPNTEEARQYVHKYVPTREAPGNRDVYVEILGESGFSCWDGRYEILLGDLLEPPTITEEVLFAPINLLRVALHEPTPLSNQVTITNVSDNIEPPPLLSSTALPVDKKTLAVRSGTLSPLAIKRPPPILSKSEITVRKDENLSRSHPPFLGCGIPKGILDAWRTKWSGQVLGSFVDALLNAVEVKNKLDSNAVGRVRAAIQAFEDKAETLTQQMEGTNPDWTIWHQLKRFFEHYERDADAPMRWDGSMLQFWIPQIKDSEETETLNKVIEDNTITFSEENLVYFKETSLNKVIAAEPVEFTPWLSGNRVFQARTGIYSVHELLNYENSWDDLSLSEIGQRFFIGIRSEIERDPSVKHALLIHEDIDERLTNLTEYENVCCLTHTKDVGKNKASFSNILESAQVIWIVGVPYRAPHLIWKQAQILFGDDAKPLCYDVEFNPYRYTDERIQGLYEQNIMSVITQIVGLTGLNQSQNKTVVLVTAIPLPGITDRPETFLFDWEDFEIAGSLDKLEETIIIRERFEEEHANLTVESGRQKIEDVLGVSKSQANRILTKLRGGKRPTIHEQIHTLLSDGEKKTAELVSAIDGHPNAIKNELKRLVDMGEIVKVRRAVYTLP